MAGADGSCGVAVGQPAAGTTWPAGFPCLDRLRGPRTPSTTSRLATASRPVPPPSRLQPIAVRYGTLAPALTSTSTPGDPSAFMTITDQSPSSMSQARVWEPAPCVDAAQIVWSAGGAGLGRPAR